MDKQIVHPYMDSAVERNEVFIQKIWMNFITTLSDRSYQKKYIL